MKRSIRFNRAVLAAILAVVAASAVLQSAYAGPSAPVVPARIAVEAGHKVFLVGHAVGVQIYSCNVVAGAYRCGFNGPRADVFDENGKLIMTHFAGPRWRAKDGSEVVGQRVDGVTVDATAIPWLLLSASPTAASVGDRLQRARE
jgi:hypothetical protein